MAECITVNLDYGHIKFDIIAIKLHHRRSLMVLSKSKIVLLSQLGTTERKPGLLTWTVGGKGVSVLGPPN